MKKWFCFICLLILSCFAGFSLSEDDFEVRIPKEIKVGEDLTIWAKEIPNATNYFIYVQPCSDETKPGWEPNISGGVFSFDKDGWGSYTFYGYRHQLVPGDYNVVVGGNNSVGVNKRVTSVLTVKETERPKAPNVTTNKDSYDVGDTIIFSIDTDGMERWNCVLPDYSDGVVTAVEDKITTWENYVDGNHRGIYQFFVCKNGIWSESKNIELDFVFLEEQYKHILIRQERKEPTCTENGYEEYWSCPYCNKLFADNTCKERLDQPKEIPALGHDFVNGKCKKCGCLVPGWIELDDGWHYGSESGIPTTGLSMIEGSWYYFDENGLMKTGWVSYEGKWYCAQTSGVLYTSGWEQINDTWYYFYPDGTMAVGWLYDGGVWYYMSPEGTMKTSWVEDSGNWYFFSDSGAMQTGWQQSGNTWYLLKPSGEMATGWTFDSGAWYYFEDSGIMKTGWFDDKDESGTSHWYWFDEGGAMAKGWKEINGQWEMFSDSGEWLYTWDG